MGFFNFVESFFFISLAITFVLIMMLVYHFKERLTILEKKTETIMDIMNGLFQDMNVIKGVCLQIPVTNRPSSESYSKIIVSDSDSESGSDSNSEYESDSDFEEVVQHIQIESSLDSTLPVDVDEIIEMIPSNTNEVNITVEIESENDEHLEEFIGEMDEMDNMSEADEMENTIEKIQQLEQSKEENDTKEEEQSNESEEEDDNIKEETSRENMYEMYKKMDVSELKSIVIQKGLATDAKKLKKTDLIRILIEA
jgi:hypothetical protein